MGEVIEAVFSNTKEKKEEVDMFIYNFLIKELKFTEEEAIVHMQNYQKSIN